MVQIRNKYHVEKKRLENLKIDNPKAFTESKWPLYEQLAFLSEHIPIRRSFRTMRCRRKYSESEYVMKSEADTDGSDADREGEFAYRSARKDPAQPSRTYGSFVQLKNYKITNSSSVPPRNAPLPTLPRLPRIPRQVYQSRHAPPLYQRKLPTPVERLPGSDKFYAFGQFLTSSLIELPEKEALVLVDQFTSELVQAYLAKNTDNDKPNQEQDKGPAKVVDCNGHTDDVVIE
ncbi:uncharacterized protein LOC129916920 [Episyrphus balteatus]|uniref:uncharacterized protein LOC129916920 n=1 Tax=Episyrphus balteatus TaxID=286459 RepID=UPI0024869ED8|nr:uncharacterized protein LOC129916920 [Episyrphus balteatus]